MYLKIVWCMEDGINYSYLEADNIRVHYHSNFLLTYDKPDGTGGSMYLFDIDIDPKKQCRVNAVWLLNNEGKTIDRLFDYYVACKVNGVKPEHLTPEIASRADETLNMAKSP